MDERVSRRTISYRVRPEAVLDAVSALAGAGFTDVRDQGDTSTNPPSGMWHVLEARRDYVERDQDMTELRADIDLIGATLDAAGVENQNHGNGVMVMGGTPEHRWLEVFLVTTMESTGLRVLVANDAEAERQLVAAAAALGVVRDAITVRPEAGWNGYE